MNSRSDSIALVDAVNGGGESGEAKADLDAKDAQKDSLKVMYQEVATQHNNIDDFRTKLLAALPVVTGFGLFALLEGASAPDGEFFAAIGIFGALASVGLFVHELRGISECYMLIELGRVLERKLAETAARCGPFTARRSVGFRELVGRETAALVIYPATIASWSFVAAAGLHEPPGASSLAVILVVAIAVLLAGGGWALLSREHRKVKRYIGNIARLEWTIMRVAQGRTDWIRAWQARSSSAFGAAHTSIAEGKPASRLAGAR